MLFNYSLLMNACNIFKYFLNEYIKRYLRIAKYIYIVFLNSLFESDCVFAYNLPSLITKA